MDHLNEAFLGSSESELPFAARGDGLVVVRPYQCVVVQQQTSWNASRQPSACMDLNTSAGRATLHAYGCCPLPPHDL